MIRGLWFERLKGLPFQLRSACVLFAVVLVFHATRTGAAASDGPTSSGAAALPPVPDQRVEFERDIRPLLKKRCLRCHGPKRRQSEYRLDRRHDALRGGLTGVAIIPGDSARSPLIHYVAGLNPDLVMPPKGKPLSSNQVGLLRAWIDQGADFGSALEGEGAAAASQENVHWAFRQLSRPAVPARLEGSERAGETPIDAFVRARLETAGLKPSPTADRVTLIRRLALSVLGLPPSPEEVDAFVNDPDAGAYEKLVDRFLASPRYGERWARHWLDVVRFAETFGFEPNKPRETAWPYRDYVIDVFNRDRPYGEFCRDQIAGDAYGEHRGTGFLVAGPQDKVESPNLELTLNKRANELHDIVSTTGSAFLGLTVGCARCHNHKFDPVSQRDYYALTAVFAGVHHGERHWPASSSMEAGRQRQLRDAETELLSILGELTAAAPIAGQSAGSGGGRKSVRPPLDARFNLDRFVPTVATALRFTVLDSGQSEPALDEIEVLSTESPRRNVAAAAHGAVARVSGTLIGFSRHKLRHINDGWYGNGRSWASDELRRGWVEIRLAAATEIDSVVWARSRLRERTDRVPTAYRIEVQVDSGEWVTVADSTDRQPQPERDNSPARASANSPESAAAAVNASLDSASGLGELYRRREELETQLNELRRGRAAYFGQFYPPPPTHRLHRGDPLTPREEVSPGAIERVGPRLELAADASEQERRVALARWLNHPENPLPARVLVNRLWLHHFGAGIVNTPSDFGAGGDRPSHPALLDWLASELVDSGGSIKHVQRLILLSYTYRQASRPNDQARSIDAQNRLLWRFPPQRLAAEPIRDSVLAVSGRLRLTMGGEGYHVFEPNQDYVRVYTPKKVYGPAEWRRMVYQFKPRMEQDAVFGIFDCPDAAQVAPKRTRSTTPLQAFNLFNSGFMLQQAEAFAARVEDGARREGHGDAESRDGEVVARAIRRAFRLALCRTPDAVELRAAVNLATQHGLVAVCRALFNSNEFLHVY